MPRDWRTVYGFAIGLTTVHVDPIFLLGDMPSAMNSSSLSGAIPHGLCDFQEYSDRHKTAHRHRLGRLFGAWHLATLASSASSKAVVRGFHRRRSVAMLAADFRAWASLSRARRWRRRRFLRHGLETLASFATGSGVAAAAAAAAFPNKRRQGTRRWEWNSAAVGALVGPGDSSLFLADRARRGLTRAVLDDRVGGEVSAGGVRAHDPEAVASAHRRRAGLSRGLRALLQTGPAELRRTRQPRFVRHGSGGERGAAAAVASARATRMACRTWLEAARRRRRTRDGADAAAAAWRRNALVQAVRELRRFALTAARQRRADRASSLRKSFTALRQVC